MVSNIPWLILSVALIDGIHCVRCNELTMKGIIKGECNVILKICFCQQHQCAYALLRKPWIIVHDVISIILVIFVSDSQLNVKLCQNNFKCKNRSMMIGYLSQSQN